MSLFVRKVQLKNNQQEVCFMALWGKDDKSQDDKWKYKYLDLLDHNEVIQQQTQENEELLVKTIQRLTLATKGFNKQLDPHLKQIHAAVKSQLKIKYLKAELEHFTKAVVQLNDTDINSNEKPGLILFDFLIRQNSCQDSLSKLNLLQTQYINGDFSSENELFLALLEVTKPELGRSDPSNVHDQLDEGQIETDTISHQLLFLIDEIDIPFEFEKQATSLRHQLKNHQSAKSFKALLDEYILLLVNLKKHVQSEQKDIECFLSHITEQLNELGLQASGASAFTKQSDHDRNVLDQFVSDQVKDLQNSSASATTLEPLKQLINTRLGSIAHQIQQHRQKEEEQRLKAQQELDQLSSKISQMELESNELKSKLLVAHDKALRDPLTGLANRMAYDERMGVEMSRWQRYKSPLSLLVWDIDHFKNINDTFGHKAGDRTLKIISNLLNENCRHLDFLSRFGGEEFTMLLPNTDKASAFTLANKLRLLIEKSKFNASGQTISITISCGISQFLEGDTPETVFERADSALYEAKNTGRNKCIVN